MTECDICNNESSKHDMVCYPCYSNRVAEAWKDSQKAEIKGKLADLYEMFYNHLKEHHRLLELEKAKTRRGMG